MEYIDIEEFFQKSEGSIESEASKEGNICNFHFRENQWTSKENQLDENSEERSEFECIIGFDAKKELNYFETELDILFLPEEDKKPNPTLANAEESFESKYQRKKSQNSCKKINALVIKNALQFEPSEKIRQLKKIIHRSDIFIVVLTILESVGKMDEFLEAYKLTEGKLKSRKNGRSDTSLKDAAEFYEKTLEAAELYKNNCKEEALEYLYDRKLKCKTYLKEAKERVENFHKVEKKISLKIYADFLKTRRGVEKNFPH